METAPVFVRDFREAAPYIDYLRGKTLVIGIASSLLSGETLHALAADINLLSSLGVRLVLVHGSRQQINTLNQAQQHDSRYHNGRRITDSQTLTHAKQVCGMLRCDIEAALSVGVVHSPQRGKRLSVIGGNFIAAKPYGVIDGVDMGYTGCVRKVDTEAIRRNLDAGSVVLISPIGASLSGKTYNLSMADIAEAVAVALRAEKLIFIVEEAGILDSDGKRISTLSAKEAHKMLSEKRIHANQQRLLRAAIHAVENQVQRTQILSGRTDGSLISELFTRNGSGTSIAQSPFMSIRQAKSSDIADILNLIRPLEEEGVLLKRSREYLENHIGEFSVLEHDCQIYGCVALKIYEPEHAAELACLVVSPNAQDAGYGELLLSHVVESAQTKGLSPLFALSTHTGDWFIERGFQAASAQDLPQARRMEYDLSGRHSKIFMLPL